MVPRTETWSVYGRPWLQKLVSNLQGETNMPSHIRRPFWLTVPALLFAIFTWKTAVRSGPKPGPPLPRPRVPCRSWARMAPPEVSAH